MSKKTNFKRIAFVTVASLGFGVLTSITPAYAADASEDDVDVTAVAANVNTGACSVSTGGQGGTFINGSRVQLDFDDTGNFYITLAGPAVFESSQATATDLTSTGATLTSTTFTDTSVVATEVLLLRLTGLGAVTVTVATSSATAAVDSFTINSVASCATSTFNAGKSNFTITNVGQTDNDLAAGTAWVTAYNNQDTADAETVAVNGKGYARAILKNEYGDNLSSKPVIATAVGTGGACWVQVENTDATEGTNVAGAPAATTSVATSNGSDLTLEVKAAVAGTAVKCAVTLTWNGIVVGTKNYILQGNPASVTVSGVTVGVKGGKGYYRATVKDALGNALPGIAISNDATETNNVASAAIVSDSNSQGGNTDDNTTASTGAVYGTTPAVVAANLAANATAYTCTSKGGAAKVTVRALQSGVTYVTSAPFDVYCGAASVDTWSISMDKASYAPGEIATLTVSAKDADGHVAQSLLALGTSEYSFGGMTFVTAPTSVDLFNSAAGAKTYKLSVGTTEGSFVGTFKITGTTDTAAKTIQYTVKASTATVTNADVLKSIVSLIASINKQIQALQKLILRR